MMIVQVAHAVLILIVLQHVAALMIVQGVRVVMMTVHQHVVGSVIVPIVRHVHAVMMIVQPVVVVRHRVVHQQVVALVIAIRVQVVRVVMMIVHAVLMIVQRVRKPMRSVVPIRYVHALVVAAMIVMLHRVTIISKSVGTMRVQLVRHAVDRVAVTTMHQSIWSAMRSVHQHQLLLT
jgi:hypothetical protein